LESQVQASQSQQRMKQRLECDEKHDFLPALSLQARQPKLPANGDRAAAESKQES